MAPNSMVFVGEYHIPIVSWLMLVVFLDVPISGIAVGQPAKLSQSSGNRPSETKTSTWKPGVSWKAGTLFGEFNDAANDAFFSGALGMMG